MASSAAYFTSCFLFGLTSTALGFFLALASDDALGIALEALVPFAEKNNAANLLRLAFVLLCYVVLFLVLMYLRYFQYKKDNYQYFLLDFCYFANFLALYYIICNPGSAYLCAVVFATCSGILLASTCIFRNLLLPHELDRSTSVFLHAAGALALYVIRWRSETLNRALVQAFPPELAQHLFFPSERELAEAGSFYTLVMMPWVFYTTWQLLFYRFFVPCIPEGYDYIYPYTLDACKGVLAMLPKPKEEGRAAELVHYKPYYLVITNAVCFTLSLVPWAVWGNFVASTVYLTAVLASVTWVSIGWYRTGAEFADASA
eukprot:Hpha_TRINITY_DN10029_c0_g1::TRINITY_DN10029_c0_g1_i1::g.83926::m.83926